MKNRKWILAARPHGMVKESDFSLVEEELATDALQPGQFVTRNVMFGFDPAMRGWIEDVPSYMPPVQIGAVMRGSAVGEVIQSRNDDFPVGALARGLFGWQEYTLLNPGGFLARLPQGTTPEGSFSAVGGSGLTAYFGLLDVGAPKEGETVVVSSAAGSVGCIVAQIAKIKGCRVIGIAGGKEKCDWLRDVVKLDGVIDYRSENVEQRLGALCPNGIHVYFDNVGGEMLQAALTHIADFGRIPMCGAISTYNDASPSPGPNNLMNAVTRRVRMQGFITSDFTARRPEAEAALQQWFDAGLIHVRSDIQHGFENIPKTFLRLFRGENQGKQMLAV